MVEIRAEFDNLEEVQAALRKYGRAAEEAIGRAVQAQALDVRGVIQGKIQRGPKTGRLYQRGNIQHRASAPGQAPATDTGTLVSSITFRRVSALTADIESRLAYAAMLEFGTARMDPRPAWTPAVEEKRPDFVRRVTNAIEALTRQAN